MKMFYVTLNNEKEAESISQVLLTSRLAVCTNWFPIFCSYRQGNEIKKGNEVVLIIKTKNNMRKAIEDVIQQHVSYTNFIAEIDITSINVPFMTWLNEEVMSE